MPLPRPPRRARTPALLRACGWSDLVGNRSLTTRRRRPVPAGFWSPHPKQGGCAAAITAIVCAGSGIHPVTSVSLADIGVSDIPRGVAATSAAPSPGWRYLRASSRESEVRAPVRRSPRSSKPPHGTCFGSHSRRLVTNGFERSGAGSVAAPGQRRNMRRRSAGPASENPRMLERAPAVWLEPA